MIEHTVVDGTILFIMVTIAVLVAGIFHDAVERYRATNDVAFRTGRLVTDLQRMIAVRRFQTHNR